MIVSASYRTDIPTFYGSWFVNRLRAGWCMTTNPYNRRPVRVSLLPKDVDGFVFWTRNVGPFMGALEEVRERGFPFVVQHTITGYPRQLDWRVVDAAKSVESFRAVIGRHGAGRCVWRYDPIAITSITPREFHLENFEKLAALLEGATDEVVISFAQFFKKTLRNMGAAGKRLRFEWSDPPDEEKRGLIAELAKIAERHSMRLGVCAQRHLLVEGTHDARCVDPERLARVAGYALQADPKGHRESCGCCQSRDIGEYDTCPHGCVYCYAVSSHSAARARFARHDPESEYLLKPVDIPAEGAGDGVQLRLFGDTN